MYKSLPYNELNSNCDFDPCNNTYEWQCSNYKINHGIQTLYRVQFILFLPWQWMFWENVTNGAGLLNIWQFFFIFTHRIILHQGKLCYKTLHRWKLSNNHYIHYYQSTWLNTKAIMIWIFVAELSLLDQQKWWWLVTMFSPGFSSSKSPENEKWCLGRVRAILWSGR